MEYSLRDYQEDMVATTIAAIPSDEFILLQAATGAGKTIFFSELIRRLLEQWPQLRIGVLAHRSILIEQARDKLKAVWHQAPIGVACASTGEIVDTDQPVVIGSVQTLVRRVETTEPFDIIIIDEAHRLPPKNVDSQYKQWLSTMIRYNPKARIIGLTATPMRLGHGYIYGPVCKPGNKNWFSRLHYKIGIRSLQSKGFLCAYRAKETVDIAWDLSSVAVSGDYNLSQLGDTMGKDVHVGSAVKAVNDYAADRKRIICFGVTIDHAEKLKTAFQSADISACVIHSKQPQSQRDMALREFQSGRMRVIVNVGILQEGFDEPATDCIVMCRPTKSAALHVQMCGRGLRPHTDKQDVLILDLSNNFKTHGDIDDPRVPAHGGQSEQCEAKMKACPNCEELVYPRVMECPSCGYIWEPEPVVENNNRQKMKDVSFEPTPPSVVKIESHEITDYTSKNGNRMVKLSLTVAFEHSYSREFVNHFLMFDADAHPFARSKSVQWWRSIVQTAEPQSTVEAIARAGEIAMSLPEYITIAEDGRWWKIASWKTDQTFAEDEVPF